MNPRIEFLPQKMLIGQRLQMALVENKTPELWQNFMPKRSEIQNTISTDLYAVQIYEPTYFEAFNPNATFEKWATLEVTTFINIPETMESLIIPGGLYAVFEHKGQSTSIFEYIFSQWIPNSKYNLDQRPHFELLGAKYKRGDDNSEEEIWIPIKEKLIQNKLCSLYST